VNEKTTLKPTAKDQGRKNSTIELPMVDLAESIQFVTSIHEKGLETVSMADLAKGLGYANPTSTPFYRRMVASRLFKLLTAQGAELTKLALDYLKPDTEEAKARALSESASSIPGYLKLVEKHGGKRLNVAIIANGMARDFGLTDDCASICAKAFHSSLKFGGFLDGNDTLLGTSAQTSKQPDPQMLARSPAVVPPETADADLETYYLTLDARKNRRVIVKAPPSVSQQELKRIQDWLSFQLLVEPPQVKNGGETPSGN
jgi:hypothetical protein